MATNGTVTTYDFPGASSTSINGFGPNGLLFGYFVDKKSGVGSFVYLSGA